MSSSPMKGIERLSEELKAERLKANQALQERAKLKIELETLRQSLESQRLEQQTLQNENLTSQQQIAALQRERQQLQHLQLETEETLAHYQQEREGLLQSIAALDETRQTQQATISQSLEEHKKLQIIQDTATRKLLAKDELIQHLQEELQATRAQQTLIEQQKLSTFAQLHKQTAENEELHSQLQLVDAMESGYQQTRSSNDELRMELENSLQLNASLNDTVRELTSKLAERSAMERSLNDQVKLLISEREEVSIVLTELDKQTHELQQQLEAEHSARVALQDKAEFAVSNRQFAEQQLEAIREKQLAQQQEIDELRAHEDAYRTQLTSFEEENVLLLSQLTEMEQLAADAQRAQVLSTELEALRGQLTAMRKQLVQRDLQDEAGVLPAQIIVEREQLGRQVYENVIADLRSEIDRVNCKFHESVRHCDELAVRASVAEQLKEEVEMYREMVKTLSAESQT